MPDTYNNQPLTVDFLLNPSHLAGVGDLLMSVYQKIFDNETVQDYDLIEMLNSASEKVKTQKLLLVAHSQGNFYANSFYDTVAGKQGGVPKESIGVYGIATPSSRVAGGGKWLTSDTDKVIAGVVGRVPFKNIMPPNTHIELQSGDDALGHNFKDVYLKYGSAKIVSDIQASLDMLSENASQGENKPCMSPPELTLVHKLEGAVLAVADPAASAGSDAATLAGTTGVKAAVWTYNAGAVAAKTVAQTTLATVSSITSAAKSLTSRAASLTGNGNNGAAIINAVPPKLPTPTKITVAANQTNAVASFAKNNQPTDGPPLPPSSAANPTIASNILTSKEKTSLPPEAPSAPKTAIKAMEEKSSPLKLVFVGFHMSGVGTSPRPTPEKLEAAETDKKNTDEIKSAVGEELLAPALTVPRCAESLAIDGCLLATTTARFEWAPVSGASYYSLNKNGVPATTTETFSNIIALDFSDYKFEVAAVGASGQKNATSSKTISVATIPIAINEIAWMGTAASAYDEWLELKNNTGHAISLSQWALESKDGAPRIALSGSIGPQKYLVLERRKNTITAAVNSAVLIYGNGSPEWALGNGGEELILSYSGTIFDGTPAIVGGAWAAGNNTSSSSRKTMERYGSKESGDNPKNWTTWGTNADFIKSGKDSDGNQILGTPGACNSASYVNINDGKNITGNLTLVADNCYYVSEGVRVAASSTLAIKAGAQVSLNKNNLYIDGVLDARGEEKNPIVFDSFSGSATSNRVIIFGNSGTSSI
ncbi:lamin tail domain-containing protein, partial [Patescibacteria group bacterium]|nr:lamin tail domain-containing protein [Patescibacteria group bacterium]